MKSHTLLELQVWMNYLDKQEASPDRHDFYLMQVALEVARKFANNPEKIKLEHFMLTLSKAGQPKSETKDSPKVDKEIQALISQTTWMAAAGFSPPSKE